MILKHTARSYKHSHKKSAKSFAKGLDKAETHLIIFSNKQQATSNKQQATSGQSGISAQSARIKTHPQQYNFSQNNLGLVRVAASPLNPQLFVGGKRDTCQTQVSLFPPTAPYLLFNAAKGDTPLETPSVNRKAYKQRFPKSCGSLKKYTPYKFAFIASLKLDWNQKRTSRQVNKCTSLYIYLPRVLGLPPKTSHDWNRRRTGRPPKTNRTSFLRMQKLEARLKNIHPCIFFNHEFCTSCKTSYT